MVQSVLRDKAGQNIVADGKFGPRTEQAVKNFQTTDGLPVDGNIDEIDWQQLYKRSPAAFGF